MQGVRQRQQGPAAGPGGGTTFQIADGALAHAAAPGEFPLAQADGPAVPVQQFRETVRRVGGDDGHESRR
ncbi:hypothetical protein Axi01nite_14890 [Actinoplanes xinjiangensis]|nr:hypothetical protein Axi01nite_14890 [Actinoplanes xinjiangensis]